VVFLGSIGHTRAMSSSTAATDAALAEICLLCRARNFPVGLSLPDTRTASDWHSRGVSLFVVDCDCDEESRYACQNVERRCLNVIVN
jgi:hypothetical protein